MSTTKLSDEALINAPIDYLSEIAVLPPAERYDTSRIQIGHWLMNRYTKDVRPFNTWITLHVPFFDQEIAYQTLQVIINRHDILRTTLTFADGQPWQVIHPFEDFASAIQFDRLEMSSGDAEAKLADEAYHHSFDPIQGPLFYVKVVETNDDAVLIFNIDHSTTDEISKSIIKKEIFEVYRAFVQKQANPLLPLRVQYKDFVSWHKQLLDTKTVQQFQNYWHRYTEESLPTANLSSWFGKTYQEETYRTQMKEDAKKYLKPMLPEHEKFIYGNLAKLGFSEASGYQYIISSKLHRALKNVAQENEASMFNIISLGFHLMVYRMTNCNDSMLGVNVPMRNNEDLIGMVGFLLNTILIRNQVLPEQTFRENLSRISAENLDTTELAFYSLEHLLRDLDFPFSRVSNIFINMMNKEDSDKRRIKDFKASHLDRDVYMTYFDLDFHITEQKNGIEILCEYNRSIFSKTQIEDIHETLAEVLTMLTTHPDQTIAEVFAEQAR